MASWHRAYFCANSRRRYDGVTPLRLIVQAHRFLDDSHLGHRRYFGPGRVGAEYRFRTVLTHNGLSPIIKLQRTEEWRVLYGRRYRMSPSKAKLERDTQRADRVVVRLPAPAMQITDADEI